MMLGVSPISKAYNGQEALTVLDERNNNYGVCPCHEQFRLVLLDNQMPVLTGIETAQRIRSLQNAGELPKTIKLALFSGCDLMNGKYQLEI